MSHFSEANAINRKSYVNTNLTTTNIYIPYVLTVLLIFISGSPIITVHAEILLIISTVVTLYLFFNQGLKLDKELVIVMVFLLIITIIHYFEFSFFSFFTTARMFTNFFFPYFAIRIIGHRFPDYFVRVFYILTLISFVFYIPTVLIPGFIDYLLQIPEIIGTAEYRRGTHLLIYTIDTGLRHGFPRNAGLFLEPGMFSVYLIIALLFNIIISKKLINKVNIVFTIALITTISTAGYLALIIVLIAYFLVGNVKKSLSIFILPFLIYGAWHIYYNVDFMGDKIDYQFQLHERGAVYAGRVGSTLNDLEDILEYPLFGRGRHFETRFDDYQESAVLVFHRTNGVTDLMVRFGLVFSFLYFYYMFKSLSLTCKYYKYNRLFAVFFFWVILVVGSSQPIFQHSMLISLIYLHSNYKHMSMVDRKGESTK